MKTSKFNKKWISQQNFSIPTGMYSGKGIVWHHMGPHAEAFFPSYDHYIPACDDDDEGYGNYENEDNCAN